MDQPTSYRFVSTRSCGRRSRLEQNRTTPLRARSSVMRSVGFFTSLDDSTGPCHPSRTPHDATETTRDGAGFGVDRWLGRGGPCIEGYSLLRDRWHPDRDQLFSPIRPSQTAKMAVPGVISMILADAAHNHVYDATSRGSRFHPAQTPGAGAGLFLAVWARPRVLIRRRQMSGQQLLFWLRLIRYRS